MFGSLTGYDGDSKLPVKKILQVKRVSRKDAELHGARTGEDFEKLFGNCNDLLAVQFQAYTPEEVARHVIRTTKNTRLWFLACWFSFFRQVGDVKKTKEIKLPQNQDCMSLEA